MEIRQLKGYRFVSVFTALICALAFQDFFYNESIAKLTFVVGSLGSFLLGIAAIAVVGRYIYNLTSAFKNIGLKNFVIGLLLMVASAVVWFSALVKFAVVPLTNGTIEFENQYPALVGLVNGLSGMVYFYLIWPLQRKCLTSHGS